MAGRKIDYAGSVHDEREIDAVVEVLRGGPTALRIGRNVRAMEQRVAELFGKRRGVMCNSGSSALYLAIEVLDLAPGDEIVTSAVTFSTDIAPMIRKGIVPAYVDVTPDTYQIDVEAIEAMIGPRTKAILAPSCQPAILRHLADRVVVELAVAAVVQGDALDEGLERQPSDRVRLCVPGERDRRREPGVLGLGEHHISDERAEHRWQGRGECRWAVGCGRPDYSVRSSPVLCSNQVSSRSSLLALSGSISALSGTSCTGSERASDSDSVSVTLPSSIDATWSAEA